MTIEHGGMPATIEPYLNPAYWNGQFIGDGTAQPWPELGEVGLKDWMLGAMVLDLYGKQGASRLASSRLHLGDTFDVNNYEHGTILLTQAEQLSQQPDAEGAPSMTAFQGEAVPNCPAGIVDGEQTRKGHGYHYSAVPQLNLVVGRRRRRVLIIPDAVVGARPDINNREFRQGVSEHISRGFREFTVGEVYNFVDTDHPHEHTLARVTEAIVCRDGTPGRGIPSLKALVAERGGLFSPAINPGN